MKNSFLPPAGCYWMFLPLIGQTETQMAQCMDDVPAFTTKTSKNDPVLQVNMPYIEHLGRSSVQESFWKTGLYMGTRSFSGRADF